MISQSTVSQDQEPKQQNPDYPLQHHPASNHWFLKGKTLGMMAGKIGRAYNKDKLGKNENAKDKFSKDKQKGKKMGTPKNKGSGPYDRQSVSVERRKFTTIGK